MRSAMRKEEIYKEILNRILNFHLKPGQPISAGEIASELGVSLTPVREVFIRLRIEKLLEVYPQSGTFVSLINMDFVEQTVFMRHILEKEMLLLACDRIKDSFPLEIEKNLSRQAEAMEEGNVERFLFYDNMFHRLLFELSGHEIIWDIIENVKIHYSRYRYLSMSKADALKDIYNEHVKILNSMKQSDKAGLEEVLKKHHFFELEEQKNLREKYPDYFTK